MKRLTAERCKGIKAGYWSAEKKDDLVQCLGRYEDTGLSPEQIREIDRLYQELSREVAGLRERQRWIPVEERLPQDNIPVLMCGSIGWQEVGWYLRGHWQSGFSHADRRKDVIAWMPLPDSYSPEQKMQDVSEWKEKMAGTFLRDSRC